MLNLLCKIYCRPSAWTPVCGALTALPIWLGTLNPPWATSLKGISISNRLASFLTTNSSLGSAREMTDPDLHCIAPHFPSRSVSPPPSRLQEWHQEVRQLSPKIGLTFQLVQSSQLDGRSARHLLAAPNSPQHHSPLYPAHGPSSLQAGHSDQDATKRQSNGNFSACCTECS